MNPETRASKRYRKKLPQGCHNLRVENPACPGTPDLNYCHQGVEGWIEFKQVKSLPKRPETPVFTGALRPEQVLWHIKRVRSDGRTFICGYVEETDEFFLIPGKYAQEFNDMCLERLRVLNRPMEALWEVSLTGC